MNLEADLWLLLAQHTMQAMRALQILAMYGFLPSSDEQSAHLRSLAVQDFKLPPMGRTYDHIIVSLVALLGRLKATATQHHMIIVSGIGSHHVSAILTPSCLFFFHTKHSACLILTDDILCYCWHHQTALCIICARNFSAVQHAMYSKNFVLSATACTYAYTTDNLLPPDLSS